MSLARSVLLSASRSQWLAGQFRRRSFARRAVRQFLPGEEVTAALDAAAAFGAAGIGSVLTCLGEQVRTSEEAAAVREEYLQLFASVHARGLPTQVSVKLTHLGLDVDEGACIESLCTLAEQAELIGSMLWIDMEEASYVDRTLAVFRSVRARHQRVGVCLQAYLRRTPADVEALLPLGSSIRLVKGAYRESSDVAFQSRREIDGAFQALTERLLDAAAPGAVIALGTHDLDLIERALASRKTGASAACEVHMLYGIRTAMQRDLASRSTAVRVLISYGENWFPWYVRRIAERPANLWFVLRNLVPERTRRVAATR